MVNYILAFSAILISAVLGDDIMCTDDVCYIKCSEYDHKCTNQTISCTSATSCKLYCDVDDSCKSTVFNCDSPTCIIFGKGDESLQDATVECTGQGDEGCKVNCYGKDSCIALELTCLNSCVVNAKDENSFRYGEVSCLADEESGESCTVNCFEVERKCTKVKNKKKNKKSKGSGKKKGSGKGKGSGKSKKGSGKSKGKGKSKAKKKTAAVQEAETTEEVVDPQANKKKNSKNKSGKNKSGKAKNGKNKSGKKKSGKNKSGKNKKKKNKKVCVEPPENPETCKHSLMDNCFDAEVCKTTCTNNTYCAAIFTNSSASYDSEADSYRF